jgi:hypothetical protein
MATLTAAAAQPGVSPKQGHIGVQCEVFASTGMASLAASDVVLCCKIPNGATILDMAARVGHKADTQATVGFFVAKAGDGSGSALFTFGAQVLSATGGTVLFRPTTASLFIPGTKVSLSDDAAVQYALLKISVTAGTTTTSMSFGGWVSYVMDEPWG